MATDLTDVLINRQMAKYNPDQFGRRPDLLSDAGTNWNAGNNQQLISQGLGNILGAIDAPAQREAIARQEAMAAEQVQYNRGQDELSNMLNQRTADRADERLTLEKNAAARAAERDRKTDLAASAQNKFLSDSYLAGETINQAITKNKDIQRDLYKSGVLKQDDAGVAYLADSATSEQRKQFEGIVDVENLVKNTRQDILKGVAQRAGDNIQGNEINDINVGMQAFESAYKPSTQATETETRLFNTSKDRLTAVKDQKLRDITGQIGGNPELVSIQSDMSAMPSGTPADLGPNIVQDAINSNPTLDQDEIYKEVESWRKKAVKGEFGDRIKNIMKNPDGWGNYALAKALQRTAGDTRFYEWGVGDFSNSGMVSKVEALYSGVEQVQMANKAQQEALTKYAADVLKLESKFGGITTGNLLTK